MIKNKVIEKLMEKFNIKHKFLTSYHPQTNGLVERFNKTLCEALTKLGKNDNWDKMIPPVLFAYRNKKHSSSKVKVFYLAYGREPKLPADIPTEKNAAKEHGFEDAMLKLRFRRKFFDQNPKWMKTLTAFERAFKV
ncbi:hypothetical protein RclHR1_00090041 [Rhizophagus clarus]|uniref:Integrase catalytic domain-containing protein n=1 Tax=Rhizophagus clarus TaxID=94130 RepID=A0A2Z6SPD9_9GLOM|nr:hypothetical protein RclHR1_00090041 [Rhizophagus clarus]